MKSLKTISLFVVQEIKELLSKGINEDEILVLYRRNKMYEAYKERFKKEKLKITGRTIHAAKGLESRAVFIIGMTEGNGGFPDIWMEDRIYQVLRPTKHDLMLEEERRLFYVALTRAREYLYLITILGNESSFINEIPDNYKILYSVLLGQNTISNKCDKCHKKIEKYHKYCPYCGFGTSQ
jgi:DNA helicase IV